jgi:hypothetical protein
MLTIIGPDKNIVEDLKYKINKFRWLKNEIL